MVAKAQDTEVNWVDVPASSIDECSAALSYATPASWSFYLPAYMKRALELLDGNASSNFPNLVVLHLTLDLGPPELRWTRQ